MKKAARRSWAACGYSGYLAVHGAVDIAKTGPSLAEVVKPAAERIPRLSLGRLGGIGFEEKSDFVFRDVQNDFHSAYLLLKTL